MKKRTPSILLTGAGGKTGRAVLAALARQDATVRALVRRPAQKTLVRAAGAATAVVADMGDAAAMRRAIQGVESVYYVAPNMHPDEVALGQIALDAARRAGAGHFVYHSVLHPQTRAMPHHRQKMKVEALLLESGIPFTILQPTAYMQNLRGGWPAIVNEGAYRVPYRVSAPIALVDLADVALVATRVLTEPGHQGATYELVGTWPLTQTAVAAALSEGLGREVTAVGSDPSAWTPDAGLSSQSAAMLRAMFTYYDRFGLVGNPGVLTWLLGRRPTSLADFIARERDGSA